MPDSSRAPLEAQLISVAQAAAILGVSERAVRRLIETGQLPAAMVSGRYIIDSSRLEELREKRASVGGSGPARFGRVLRRAVTWLLAAWRKFFEDPITALLTLISTLQAFGFGPSDVGRLWAAVIAGVNAAMLVLKRVSDRRQRIQDYRFVNATPVPVGPLRRTPSEAKDIGGVVVRFVVIVV